MIEGIKRSGSVATQAGVSFDELVGVITAVQAKTARGGAVIGNSFKTIFTRIQSIDKLRTMQNLGVEVTDASGQVLGATKLIQNLAKSLEAVPDARKLQIAEGLVGKFQVAPFLAILDDYSSKTSKAIEITKVSQGAFSEAYNRNEAQNITLSAAINKTTVSVAQLAEVLGKIGVTDNLKSILGFFTTVIDEIQEILDGDGLGSKFAKGIMAGIGNIITGPAFAVFAAVIGKLVIDLVRFGAGSLKTFFGLNKAAKEQATLQGQIASTLLGNKTIQKKILDIENSQLSTADKRKAQVNFFTTALNEQVGIMTRMQGIAATIAPGVMTNTRKLKGRGAGGFIPNYNAIVGYGSERADISKGVGGAPSSARPVTIPNFNFGGGQKGTMVANSSEYIVPNYAGGDGSAIFNQDMAASIGLPSRASKIGAAGGYIPNFATKPVKKGSGSKSNPIFVPFAGLITPRKKGGPQPKIGKFGDSHYKFNSYGIDSAGEKARETEQLTKLVREYSISKAREESKFMTGGDPLAANITKLSNQGSIGSLAGSIFETALSSLLKSPEFDMGETGTFDFVGKKAVDNISQLSPSLKGSKVNFLEAKISDETRHLNSMAKKIVTYFGPSAGGKNITAFGRDQLKKGAERSFSNVKNKGSLDINASGKNGIQPTLNRAIGLSPNSAGVIPRGPRGASGYIPNFAGGLQDSIARESAAGLPINQIRINQDSKLRNSGNPMGLAVTNTRDEPTGAIPNFAKGSKPSTGDGMSGDFLTKIFAVQIGMSALSGVLGEVTDKNKTVANSLTALNVVISAAMTAQAFGGFASIGKNLGSTFSRRPQSGTLGRSGFEQILRGNRQAGRGSKQFGEGMSSLFGVRNRGGLASRVGGAKDVFGGGMANLAGRFKSLGGVLMRFAGPLGAAGGAILAFNKGMDIWSGRSEIAAVQTKMLGESAKIASRKLASLEIPEELRAKISARSESRADMSLEGLAPERQGIIENLRADFNSIKGEDLVNPKFLFKALSGIGLASSVVGAVGGNVEGTIDSKLEANFREVIKQAGQSSLSPEFIAKQEEIMDASRRSRGDNAQLKGEEIQTFVNSLLQQMQSLKPQKIISQVSESLSSEDLSLIREADRGKNNANKAGVDMTESEVALNARATAIIMKAFEDQKLRTPSAGNMDTEVLTAGVRTRASTGDTRTGVIDKIRGDLAKNQLKNSIDLAKLRATELSEEEKLLANDKFRKKLTVTRKAELEGTIALQKIDLSTNQIIGDSIKERINSLESVDFNLEEQALLKEKINGLSLKQLTAEGKVEEIINQTLDLDNQNKDQKIELIKLLNDEISATRELGAEKKKQESNRRKPDLISIERSRSLTNQADINTTSITRNAINRGVTEKAAQNAIDEERARLNPNELPIPKALAQNKLTNREEANAEASLTANVVDKMKKSIIELKAAVSPEGQTLENEFKALEAAIENEGIGAAELVKKFAGIIAEGGMSMEFGISDGTVGNEKFGQATVTALPNNPGINDPRFNEETTNAVKKLGRRVRTDTEEDTAGIKSLKDKNASQKTAREELLKYIEGFRTFSEQLNRFTFDLKQSTEDLKLDLVFAKDGASAISNIDQRLFNIDAGAGGKQASATASDKQALRGATDRITLARTSAERRAAIKNKDILGEELALKTTIAKQQKDGVEDGESLIILRERLIELEKKRLAIGTSRAELFENTFVFDEQEIKEGLDIALVQNAKTFVDTIRGGLVDAIAKSQDLGDTLKQAGANFFNQQANANLDAAFKNITSSGFVKNIASVFSDNPNAKGGPVTGGSGSKDDVPALLMGGEFVMRKSAVQKYGSGFMNSLNSGNMPAMARGGLFTPGTFGQGEMKGKQNLLDFATQSFTSDKFDKARGGSGFASVNLAPQSASLTMFGRRNSPAFQREQASKQKAFGLFTNQMAKEKAAKEKKSGFSKILRDSLLSFGASFAFNKLTNLFGPKVDISKASEGLDMSAGNFASARPPSSSYGAGILQGGSFGSGDARINRSW